MCSNYYELVHKHPTHLAISVLVVQAQRTYTNHTFLTLWWCVSCRFEEVRGASTTPHACPTHLEHCAGVVRVGALCLNHPELVLKHPTHLALSVRVWFV